MLIHNKFKCLIINHFVTCGQEVSVCGMWSCMLSMWYVVMHAQYVVLVHVLKGLTPSPPFIYLKHIQYKKKLCYVFELLLQPSIQDNLHLDLANFYCMFYNIKLHIIFLFFIRILTFLRKMYSLKVY